MDYRELERYAREYWRRKAAQGSYKGPVFTMNADGAVAVSYGYDYDREWAAKGFGQGRGE